MGHFLKKKIIEGRLARMIALANLDSKGTNKSVIYLSEGGKNCVHPVIPLKECLHTLIHFPHFCRQQKQPIWEAVQREILARLSDSLWTLQ